MRKIRYNLDGRWQDDKYIFLMIYYNGQRIKAATKQKIKPSEWNFDLQRAFYCSITNTHVNKMLDKIEAHVVAYINDVHITQQTIDPDRIKSIIHEVTSVIPTEPVFKIADNVLFSRDKYFARFHEFFSEHGDMIRAYYDVELEWNEAGVSMCPNYEAFKVAKSRYFAKKKRGFKIRAI